MAAGTGIVVFILGLIIGSFLNVCICRIPESQSVALPASYCMACGQPLKKRDLVPVVSYMVLKGKCRYCLERISPQYPAVELLNGLFYVCVYIQYGMTVLFFAFAILTGLLLVVSFIDYSFQIIPDRLVLFGIVISMLFRWAFSYPYSILDGSLGFLTGGGIFFLIAWVAKGAMGGGDIKLMAMLGLWLGVKNILMVSVLAFFIGAAVSIVLMILKRKGRKDMIPFGPFIAAAAMLVILYGKEIFRWYMRFIVG